MGDLMDDAEGIAEQASSESGLDDRPNADPAILAVCYLGLVLVPRRGRGSRLVGDHLIYPASATPQEAAYFQAHECGHALARLSGLRLSPSDEELVASRVGCALLLPRRALIRDIANHGRCARALCEFWPLVTKRIMERRVEEVLGGYLFDADEGSGVHSTG